jgi:hypothetical protein
MNASPAGDLGGLSEEFAAANEKRGVDRIPAGKLFLPLLPAKVRPKTAMMRMLVKRRGEHQAHHSLHESQTSTGAPDCAPNIPTIFSDTKANPDPMTIDMIMLMRGLLAMSIENMSSPGLSKANAATAE